MRKIYALIVCALLFGAFRVHAQDKGAKKAFRKGKIYYKRNDFIRAVPFFKESFNLDPENAECAFMAGRSLFESGEYAAAKTYLVAAYNQDRTVDSRINYYLGRTMHWNHLFEEAITFYEADMPNLEEGSFDYVDTEARIAQCKNATTVIERPVPFRIENLGEFVNTTYPEYASTFADNYNYMIFTTRRPRKSRQVHKRKWHAEDINEEVYEAQDIDGVWMKTKLFIRPIPRWTHDASIALSEDGKTMIYYVDNRNYGDVYVSRNEDGKWSKRESIGDNINTKNSNEPSVFIADEGQTLYWVSDKPGGTGYKDIYMSKLQSDGSWGEGTLLGPNINSPYDDDAPFISEDGKKFYFASRGHSSIGGYDIFVCDRLPDGSWGEPQNLGYPINSVGDDIYFVQQRGTEGFFFSSERPGGYGEKDIYYAEPLKPEEMPNTTIVAGTVVDRTTGIPVEAEVRLMDPATEEILATTNTNPEDGDYRFVLPNCGIEYKIDVKVKGCEGVNPVVRTGKYNVISGKVKDAVTEVPLDAVVELIDPETSEVLETVTTNPVTGRYALTAESGRPYMVRVKSNEYLRYYETFKVEPTDEVIAHYDDIGMQKQTEANKLVITWQFFDVDKYIIKRDYYDDLEHVVQVMKKIPTIKLNVIGHTDWDNTEAYNQVLSENRANEVANYLVERGVSRNRLNISGMGEAMPLYDNSNAKLKKWNRRVELYIIDE
ncbi:MAG: OmpA family protein [Bacteroidota bacterium]